MILDSSDETVDFERENKTSSGEQAYPYDNASYYPISIRSSNAYKAEASSDRLVGEDYISQYSPFADPSLVEHGLFKPRNEFESEVAVQSPFANEQDNEQEEWSSFEQEKESISAQLTNPDYEIANHPEAEAANYREDQTDLQETSLEGESIFADHEAVDLEDEHSFESHEDVTDEYEDVTDEYEKVGESTQEISDDKDVTYEDESPFPNHELFTLEDASAQDGIDHLFEMEYHIGEEQGKTVYLKTSGVKGKPLQTGVFIPTAFQNGDRVNIILYFHGLFKNGDDNDVIEKYWSTYSNVPEFLYQSNRDCILITPGLTHDPQKAELKFLDNYGLDTYISDCLRELKTNNVINANAEPGSIILAGHSAGGYPLRNVVRKTNTLLSNVTECWGFDCFYNYGWGATSFSKPFFHYWAKTRDGNKSGPDLSSPSR